MPQAEQSISSLADLADPSGRRRPLLSAISFVLWGLTLATVVIQAVLSPSPMTISFVVALVVLFIAVYAQMALMRLTRRRAWARTMARMTGSAYISEDHDVPNRNYLLDELRREMPRARDTGATFTIAIVSLDELAAIRMRRGEDFARRSETALVQILQRLGRASDFVAHLGGPRFCLLLIDCNRTATLEFLKRVPGTIPVSDGVKMLDVPVTARVYEYDMESIYAIDVLREAEECAPLRRGEYTRMDALPA